jgi:hypothetical protein
MGCFGSRFDKRNSVADDLNTVAFQFVGGEAQENDKCPIDKIALKYGAEAEPADWAKVGPMKCTDEEFGKKIALELDAALTAHLSFLEKEYGTPDKTEYVGGKFELKDAKAQILAVKTHLREKCAAIEFPADPVPEATAEPMMMEEGMEKAPMEEAPMEEAMAMGADEMMAAPDLYASDAGTYDGFENLPALILRNYVVNPYFGDLLKRDIICAEFNASPNHKDFTSAAMLVGLALDQAETAEKDIWFAGYLGAEDVESLKTIPENGNIMFPGVVAGWASEEEATKNGFHDISSAKNDIKKVVFTGKTKTFSSVVCREFVYRFNAKVEKQEEKEGTLYITLADDSWEYKTLADWKAKVIADAEAKAAEEAAAAAAGAVAPAVDAAEEKVMDAVADDAAAM